MSYIRTQKTQVYVVNGATTAIEIKQVASIAGLGGGRSQINVTHLMSDEEEFVGGLASPGPVTLQVIWDEADTSHTFLESLRDSGDRVEFMIAYEDGTSAPTVAAGAFEVFTSRTNRKFLGYVSDINLDLAQNEVVRATVTIQRSGPFTITKKL